MLGSVQVSAEAARPSACEVGGAVDAQVDGPYARKADGPAAPCEEKPTGAQPAQRSSRERVARFRAKNPRFDWTPSEAALRIFEYHRRANPTMTASNVLDRLVELAHRAVAGNARR